VSASASAVGGRTRLVDRRTAGQLLRFAGVGATCTVLYLALYSLLRDAAGAQPANLVALLVTAMANTAANRRLTFEVRGRAAMGRHQAQGLVVFGIGLGLTSGALALLDLLRPERPRLVELAVLVLANGTATVVRFLLLRRWVFGAGAQPAGTADAAT
jgi:putative flippase GtrA